MQNVRVQLSGASKDQPAALSAASQQPAADGMLQTVMVRVEYELHPSTMGLSFCGPYAYTTNEVHGAYHGPTCTVADGLSRQGVKGTTPSLVSCMHVNVKHTGRMQGFSGTFDSGKHLSAITHIWTLHEKSPSCLL